MTTLWNDIGRETFSRLTSASVQGGAVIAVAWVVCRMLPRLSPGIRCWIWRLAFAKLLLAMVWTSSVDIPILPAKPHISAAVLDYSDFDRFAEPAGGTTNPLAPPKVEAETPDHDGVTFMFLAWALGAAISGGFILRQCVIARNLVKSCSPINDPELLEAVNELRISLRIRRPPLLLSIPGAGSPSLTRLFRPVILLPSELTRSCSRHDLRLMLAHELAHHKRKDLWWCLLPSAVHTLFYFHPLVWMANQEWRLSHEMACDELSLIATRSSPAEFGSALLRVAAGVGASRSPGLAVIGTPNSPTQIKRRLIAMKHFRSTHGRTLAAVVLTGLAASIVLIPWRVVAQTPASHSKSLTLGSAKPTVAIQKPTDGQHALRERLQALEQQVKRLESLIRDERQRSAEQSDRARMAEKMAIVQKEHAEQEAQTARMMASKQDKEARLMRRNQEEMVRHKMLQDSEQKRSAERALSEAKRMKLLEERGLVSKADAEKAARDAELKALDQGRGGKESRELAERYAQEKALNQEHASREKQAFAEKYAAEKALSLKGRDSKERAIAEELEKLRAELRARDAQIDELKRQPEKSSKKKPQAFNANKSRRGYSLSYRDRLAFQLDAAKTDLMSALTKYTVDHPAVKSQQAIIQSLEARINALESSAR